MGKTILWIVIAILIVGGGIYLYSHSHSSPATSPVAPSQQVKQNVTTAVSPTAEASSSAGVKQENMVTLTANGFEPQTITIKAGTKVTWTNKSGQAATVNSDPHPVHTDYPPLNLGRFNDGGTLSLTFDKPGHYGYHNHLNPSETGVVIVE